MTIDKMIEEAARAFWSYGKDRETGLDDLKAALSTIAPLSDLAGVKAGTHVIVPVEPTEAMLSGADKTLWEQMKSSKPTARNDRNICIAIYKAMLASRPTEQSDDA